MTIKSKALAVLAVIFLFSSAAFAVPPRLNPVPSDYHTGITWEDAQKSNKPIAVNFYVDWCGACRRFAPIFDKLRKEYQNNYSFVIVKTDDPKNTNIVRQYNISSYPSVYLIGKKDKKVIFEDQQKYFNIQELKKELDNFLADKKGEV